MTYQQQWTSFGRVPPETVALFQRTVQVVRQHVVAALPAQAGAHIRSTALELVLGVVFRVWMENGNPTGLVESDVVDLRNFVLLAASLAGPDLNGEGMPIFKATLEGLLEEWLENWNSPGDPGPPGPIN